MSKALNAAILPQYQASPAFMERFLDAAHKDGAEIERSPNTRGIKLIDGSEVSADALNYFYDNKTALEEEFLSDLISEIGKIKAEWFCDVISNDWYDGRGLRNGPRVVKLKVSIQRSLKLILPTGAQLSSVVEHPDLPPVDPMLEPQDIAKLLKVNRQMMIRHIEAWKLVHPESEFISDDDIFIRRGLSLKVPIDVNQPYKEWDYLNSYSIAFSAPEKFAQMVAGSMPAIVNGDLHIFNGRILFFSPFIPKMPVGQLEVGIIPSMTAPRIKYQGMHGGISEYVIGDRPD